ncbi:hypothetical protein [Tardiphaga sp.]|uniref:hypothetical protein n=1 Tax=Tardiphaga sp. TaxID=1926292 RepID=UPI0026327F74|nr:hypothetical protein [Tardiphaga sp.]MDB5620517.1 hypothetical protein [Tardiphaga sp.]
MPVIAINRSEGAAILNDGTTAQFSNMLDICGDETDNMAEAVCAVVPLPDGMWEVVDFSQFDPVAIH